MGPPHDGGGWGTTLASSAQQYNCTIVYGVRVAKLHAVHRVDYCISYFAYVIRTPVVSLPEIPSTAKTYNIQNTPLFFKHCISSQAPKRAEEGGREKEEKPFHPSFLSPGGVTTETETSCGSGRSASDLAHFCPSISSALGFTGTTAFSRHR